MDARGVGQPTRLLYLGFDHLYAIYEVDHQLIGVNMISKNAKLASKLEAKMPSPEVYKSNKKATKASKSESLMLLNNASLTMSYYNGTGRGWCGPCSGTSIGKYYRDVLGYDNLPSDNGNMYDYLYYSMFTYWWGNNMTVPADYGLGMTSMTETSGYYNFSYANDWIWSSGDYWDRVSDIDNGWPIAICSSQFGEPWSDPSGNFPPDGWHWVAMRGYDDSDDHLIQVTDSYTSQSNLWLDWDNLGTMISTVTIID